MKKLSNKELIALASSFGAMGFVFLFLDLFRGSESQIIHAYYFGMLFLGFAILCLIFLVVKFYKDDEEGKKEDFIKSTPIPKTKITSPTPHTTYKNRKLTTCKACGAEIAKTAKHCPHCGARTPTEAVNQFFKSLLFAIVFLVVAYIVVCLIIGNVIANNILHNMGM